MSWAQAVRGGIPDTEKVAAFVPPELATGRMILSSDAVLEASDGDELSEFAGLGGWDVAVRYHEFKVHPAFKKNLVRLRKASTQAILDRARRVLGSVVAPAQPQSRPWTEVPLGAQQVELDVESTLENAEIWMEYRLPSRQTVILSVDTSLSMTGEKLALTAVALAVVLLQFADDPVGVVAFETQATVLKDPAERVPVDVIIERFLDIPAQGYTHLEEGMAAALRLTEKMRSSGQGRPPSTVLLTDGKYTAGKDPAYLAARFPHLVVLKMGKERASLELCRELAHKGRGTLEEVPELQSLPGVMYSVVKDLLRGRGK